MNEDTMKVDEVQEAEQLKKYMKAFPYEEVRPQQASILQALAKIDALGKFRYTVIEAGTGVGKSGIAKAVAGVAGKAFLLTATKQLQDQYLNTFDDGSLVVLKGKANYPCAVDQNATCAAGACIEKNHGQALKAACRREGKCPYMRALQRAAAAKVVVMSYALFLSLTRVRDFAKVMDRRPVLIIDECHLLEDQLVSFAAFDISRKELERRFNLAECIGGDLTKFAAYLNDDFGPFAEERVKEREALINWLKIVVELLRKRVQLTNDTLSLMLDDEARARMSPDDLELLNKLDRRKLTFTKIDAEQLFIKLENFLKEQGRRGDDNWLISVRDPRGKSRSAATARADFKELCAQSDEGRHEAVDRLRIVVQPVEVNGLFKTFMDDFAQREVVFMSATIIDLKSFCTDIGVDGAHTALIRRPSTFDPRRSPIVVDPVGSMSRQNLRTTMGRLLERIDAIMDDHAHEKGVIHTVSGVLARAIFDGVRPEHRRRLLIADGVNNEELLRAHRASTKPTVLISPSMMAGVDLEDDLARWQVIAKFPFASLGDPRVSRKLGTSQGGQEWYTAKMLRSFVQACGRGTRSEEDWCVTYVLDGYVQTLQRRYMDRFDEQFRRRFVDYTKFDINKFRSELRRGFE